MDSYLNSPYICLKKKKPKFFYSSLSCQRWQADLSPWLPSAWLLAVTSKRKAQIGATMPLTPLQYLLIFLFNKERGSLRLGAFGSHKYGAK